MKKIIGMLLSVIMLFSLVACGGNGDNPGTTGTPPATPTATPAGTDTPAPTQPSNPATSTLMTDAEKEAKIKEMFGDIQIFPEFLTLLGGDTGYVTDDVDHHARDKYRFAFVGSTSSAASKNIVNGIMNYQNYFNFELVESYSDGDIDKYMTLLETYALNDIDGFLLNPDNNVFPRVVEALEELEIPYVFILTAYRDSNGHNMVPIVGQDDYLDGGIIFEWLLDNYKDYFGDVDLDKVGVAGLHWSTNAPMVKRVKAGQDIWNEKFPGRENQFFYIDTAAQSSPVTQEAAYNEVAAFLTSHSEYDYWLIPSAAGLFANGAARAIEGLGMQDKCLVISIGIEELINSWNVGYDGCWVACDAIDPAIYGLPMLAGLLALVDGRATADTLWSELKKDGDNAAYYVMETTVITKDVYLEYGEACAAIKDYFSK